MNPWSAVRTRLLPGTCAIQAGPGNRVDLGDAQLWFESFQNWQSEFLSTAVLAVLTIFLRQRGSPESKPVAAPTAQTGA